MGSTVKCFEDLPDEIILFICRYLTQVNILDSFLNLNIRLNRTISSYREKIYLSHLSFYEFFHILHHHLPNLSSNVHYLYINNCSMVNAGKLFEKTFIKIDVQFPLLKELVFYQIDIETLENLSWRFNTMKCLHRLDIDISNECLSSRPNQFDEFLCGKLFSKSNSFEILQINFTKYFFSLETVKQKCTNIRQLTISIRHLTDLFILFEHLPNIERLNISISCSWGVNDREQIFPFKQLWWKVPYLTQFSLNIIEDSLISHENIPSNELILKLIENLYALEYFRFCFNIQFHSSLRSKTNRDVYINTYLPFIDGTLWEKALYRTDERNIRFEFYFELDGFSKMNQLKETIFSNKNFPEKYEDIDFRSNLKNTFSSSYWLQKNISFDCLISTCKHVSISTCPINVSNRTILDDIINQDISKKSNHFHGNIENLNIISNCDVQPSSLSLIDLFKKYPNLIHLDINSHIFLPSIQTICSTRLRSLVLNNCEFDFCSQILSYLPHVISLTMTNSKDDRIEIPSNYSPNSFDSIIRLKIIYNMFCLQNLSVLEKHFLHIKEFHLTIENLLNNSSLNHHAQPSKIENLSFEFPRLRYAEIRLPYDKHVHVEFDRTINESDTYFIQRTKSSNNRYLILRKWT